MNTLKLMRENSNWRDLLANAPYYLTIREKDDLALLKYNMLESDMYNEIVQECRGVIVDTKEMKVVCNSYKKFFNATEPQAAKLEGKIRAEEKVDGSIIKMFFYKGEWRVATNGTIDARDADLMIPYGDIRTYRDLFDAAFAKYLDTDTLSLLQDENYTLIFELISPVNRIVVAYPETDLVLLGIRENTTGDELDPRNTHLGKIFKTPKIYDIDTIDQALEVAKTLGVNEEGFVLVDENFNRVKVKGAEYLAMHRMRSNNLSLRGFLATVLNNSQDDLIAYFPEYTPFIDEIQDRLKGLISEIEDLISTAPWDKGKKDFALQVKDKPHSSILFKLYGNEDYDWKGELLNPDNINRLIRLLGL